MRDATQAIRGTTRISRLGVETSPRLVGLIRKMGPEVIQSSNGRRAWEFLDDNPDVALVISDVVMPEMGGRDFITMVRADPRFESLPLLIISAYVGVLGVAGLLDRGASAFLRKPVDLAELTEIIERHLSPIPPSA